MRVSFQENTAAVADISYFVDFKMTEGNKGAVILLKGEKNTNVSTGNLLGIAGVKTRFLENLTAVSGSPQMNVHIINVEKWRELSDSDKYAELFTLTRQ